MKSPEHLWTKDVYKRQAAESIIDGMNYRCVLRSRSYIRRQMYADLKRQMKVLTAEKMCIRDSYEAGEIFTSYENR